MTKPEITDYTLRKAKRIRFSSETFTRIKPKFLIEFDNNNGKWIIMAHCYLAINKLRV